VRCIPKLVVDEAQAKPAEEVLDSILKNHEQPWSRNMSVSELKKLVESEVFPPHTVGYPAPKSHSPDVIMQCLTQQPLMRVIAGFQCKLGDTPITWKVLQEELNNAEWWCNVCDELCLVVVAFTLGAELQAAFGAGSTNKLVVSSGRYTLTKEKKLEKISQEQRTRGGSQEVKLEVPVKMQLVVLGDDGLQSFLGADAVAQLRTLLQTRANAATVETMLPSLAISHLTKIDQHKQLEAVTASLAALSMAAPVKAAAAAASSASSSSSSPPPQLPFNLESFLRDDAGLDDESIKEYQPVLKKNKVDEKGLHLLTDSNLKEMGVVALMDRVKILDAVAKHTGKK